MVDEVEVSEGTAADISPDDLLNDLKHRADVLGVNYHPSIGVDKLSAKVQDALEASKQDEDPEEAPVAKPTGDLRPETVEKRTRIDAKSRATELVRVRVTCMDPSKKEYEGEIFCAGNSVTGTTKNMCLTTLNGMCLVLS